MKVLFYVILSLCSILNLIAQKQISNTDFYYSCNWDKLTLNKNYKPTNNDTVVFVASTRNYNETQKQFLDYDFDTTNTLHYFAIYYKNDLWVAVPYSNLNELLNTQAKFKNVVVFTEGLGKTFSKAIDRATKFKQLYCVDVILFDWPTSRPYLKRKKDIRLTYRLSEKVAKPYAQFLNELQTYKNNHPSNFNHLTLLNHSMGNLLLMHGLQQNYFVNLSSNFADNVILNAACVNQKKHEIWLNKLVFTKHNYVTINNHDLHLRIARVLFSAKQLGTTQKPKKAENTSYVSFSNILKKEHNYFLINYTLKENPTLKLFYTTIFEGNNAQVIYKK